MRFGRLLLAAFLFAATAQAAPVTPQPKVHVVHDGQRLGSIAKRYNVSVEALCAANGISRTEKIRPGQKLVIPGPDDKDGSQTRKTVAGSSSTESRSRASGKASTTERDQDSSRKDALPAAERVHRVESGQRLESIAKRYSVSVDAICEVNRLRKTDTLKLGQTLVIPPSDTPVAVKLGVPKEARAKRNGRRGYVELYTYTARWRGQVTDSKGRVLGAAITGISRLLGVTGTKPRLDPRLIRLLAEVSDQFGGRPIRIVSGYRTNSYYDDSRHRLSRAVDFSIPGVSNESVRDYLRRFERVGVGYYPNSSFVHLDVRETAAYWVDYAGPGEAPRTKPRVRSSVAQADADEHDHDHDDQAEAKQAAAEREPGDATGGAATKEAEVAPKSDVETAPTKPASFTSPPQML
jgi:LysM repeat protein